MRRYIIAVIISSLLAAGAAALPRGYDGIELGMSLNAAKDALRNDGTFGYRGDRDVSLLPGQNNTLIETDAGRSGASFFDRCYFQFHDEKLSSITLSIRRDKMDYFSVLTALTEKYGEPQEFSPTRCIWQDSSVIVALEKPLILKYTDAAVHRQMQEASSVEFSANEKRASDFLDSL